MTNIKRKTTRKAPLVVALFVALGVMSTTSPAVAKPAKPGVTCPQQIGQPCGNGGKRPALVPQQPRPKLKPAQITGPYGGPVWRSGPWLMS